MVNMNFDAYSSANMCGACGTRGACSGGRCPGPEASGILASGGINCCPGCASAIGCEGGDCPGPSACLRVRFGMRGNTHGNAGCTLSLAKREYSRANNTLQELPRTPGRGRLFPTPETKQFQPRLPGPPEGNFPLIPPPPPPTTELRYPNQPEQPGRQVLQPRQPPPPTTEQMLPRAPTPPKPTVFQPLPSQPTGPQAQVGYAEPPASAMPPKSQMAYVAPPSAEPAKAQVAYVAPPVSTPPASTKTSAPLPPPQSNQSLGPITHAAGAVDMYGIPQGYGPRPSGQTAHAQVTAPANMTTSQRILAQAALDRAAESARATIDANRQVQLEREHTITNIAGVVGGAIGETGATIRAVVASSNETAIARLRIQSQERIQTIAMANERAAAEGRAPSAEATAQMAALQTLVTTLAARQAELAAPPPTPTQTTTQALTATPTAEEAAAARNKTILYVGLGVVGVAAVGGVAYLALRKKDAPHSNPNLPSYPPGAYASQYGIR